MKYVLAVYLCGLFCGHGYAQDNQWRQFVNSFSAEKSKTKILDFRDVMDRNNKMTNVEALKYVYNGDTTKLHCIGTFLDMETEKVHGTYKVSNIPRKCLRIEMDNFILIGYAWSDCYSTYLNLLILNKQYQITDSMTVCKGNEYDYDSHGLLNPSNIKLIVYTTDGRNMCLYYVNEKLKFGLVKKQDNIASNTDDLNMVLDRLGWKEEFMK
jgi:hypothetical protein